MTNNILYKSLQNTLAEVIYMIENIVVLAYYLHLIYTTFFYIYQGANKQRNKAGFCTISSLFINLYIVNI